MNRQQLRARTRRGLLRSSAILVAAVALAGIGIAAGLAVASQKCATSQVCWDPPYANMPDIAPPIVRTAKYLPVSAAARGPAIDSKKGYRSE